MSDPHRQRRTRVQVACGLSWVLACVLLHTSVASAQTAPVATGAQSTASVGKAQLAQLAPLGAGTQATPSTAELERSAQARALFEQGLALAAQKDWAHAADRFQRSSALRASAVVQYNWASSLVELGQLVAAVELLRQIDGDAATSVEVRAAARGLLTTAAPRVARLTVVLDDDPRGAQVFIDDRPLHPAVLGVPMPADPGAHALRATSSSGLTAETGVSLADGENATAHLSLQAAAVAASLAATPQSAPPRRASAGKAWVWATAFGGIVLVSAVAFMMIESNGPL